VRPLRRPGRAAVSLLPAGRRAQRLKIVDFFRPHPSIEQDRGKALRVSRYFGASRDERHVRFSVWDEQGAYVRAEAAGSLDEAEAARLARFLADAPTEGIEPGRV
jgi:hypothetical protein